MDPNKPIPKQQIAAQGLEPREKEPNRERELHEHHQKAVKESLPVDVDKCLKEHKDHGAAKHFVMRDEKKDQNVHRLKEKVFEHKEHQH